MIPENELVVLDTNILLAYTRANDLASKIEAKYQLRQRVEKPIICVVSMGEMLALAEKLNWQSRKRGMMQTLFQELVVVDINNQEVLEKYAEIDAYLHNMKPSRKIGKNDLWIASVAALAGGYLLSTDQDFDPLNKLYFKFIYIDPATGP